MTDQRLRRLERDAAASPSPESEAALLRERLRAGTLSLERLELAAYCGHEAALDVVGRTCDRIHPGCPHGDLCLCCGCHEGVPLGVDDCWRGKRMHVLVSDFAAGLSRWGPAVQVRAAVAAARAALAWRSADLDLWPDSPGFLWGPANRAVEAAERWLQNPTADMLPQNLPREFPLLTNAGDTRCFFQLLCCLPSAQHGWNTEANGALEAVRESAALAGELAVRSAIQSALITWALGSQG